LSTNQNPSSVVQPELRIIRSTVSNIAFGQTSSSMALQPGVGLGLL